MGINRKRRPTRRSAHPSSDARRRGRQLRLESDFNPEPDTRKMARAVIALAMRQAADEAAARAEHEREQAS